MNLKTGILMLLVGIAILGMTTSSVSANTAASVHTHGNILLYGKYTCDDAKNNDANQRVETKLCRSEGNGHAWAWGWGNGASQSTNTQGGYCYARASACNGCAYAFAECK